MRKTIRETIKARDDLEDSDIDEMFDEARAGLAEAIENGSLCDAEDIVADVFGLEPDFLDDPELGLWG